MPFLAPAILPLLALASVPVIIHLLNRLRYRRIDWAPMKYLKLTIKSSRRKLRLEQLLLLILRTLVVAVLILAVARPVLSQTGLGAWLGSGVTRTSRIIVIDDSLSMGFGLEGHTAIDTARQAAEAVLQKIGSQDRVTLLTTSTADEPLVHEVDLTDRAKVISALQKLGATETANDWPTTLRAVDRYLSTATFQSREIILITDLRRSGWGKGAGDLAGAWAGAGATVRVIDVGSRDTANVALLGLEQETPVALPGGEVRVRATLRNDRPTPVTGAEAVLTVGDKPRRFVLPDLAPGAVVEVPISLTPTEPGPLAIKLALPSDALPQDNARWLVIDVRPQLDLQLVDGEPSGLAFESATDFLALSFGIGSEPWRVSRSGDADWAAVRPMHSPDVLTLANVASISPENVTALEQRVRDGMGLMIFCGEQIDPQLYNQRLYKEGAGLLPGRLERPAENDVTGLVVEQLEHSPLATLGKLVPAALARIAARKFMVVTVPAGQTQGTRVLARWNDPEAHPAVVEKQFGRGRVILWTMSANKQWGDWPLDPTYVLAVRSAALAVVRPQPATDNITAGQPFVLALPAGQTAADVKVSPPHGENAEPGTIDQPNNAPVTLHFNRTSRAGLHSMKWRDPATGAEQSHPFAANPDKAESDLAPLSDEQLTALLSPLTPQIIHYDGAAGSLAGQGKEIWRMLAMGLLGMMIVETTFAVWVGRER